MGTQLSFDFTKDVNTKATKGLSLEIIELLERSKLSKRSINAYLNNIIRDLEKISYNDPFEFVNALNQIKRRLTNLQTKRLVENSILESIECSVPIKIKKIKDNNWVNSDTLRKIQEYNSLINLKN